jgi:hypothetical protein
MADIKKENNTYKVSLKALKRAFLYSILRVSRKLPSEFKFLS